ncbi:MAG: energy-coupling factor transporter transmembrane protein EcfT [Mycoplasma sp.]|nr:energy-coupling factor transporter transmembrane protein EcfT [Mycoplasma sp.]
MKVSLGRYLPGNSLIHKIDARIKFFANIAFIVLFFLANNFIIQGIILLPLIFSFIISTKKPLYLLKMMIMPLIVGIFMWIINMFVLDTSLEINNLVGSNAPEWQTTEWWNVLDILRMNYVILITTCSIVIRIYGIMLTMTIFTLSTQPVLITKALDFYFYPLRLIKIPTHIFTMIISIAFRFVPTLVDEASRIFKAQASRGMDFKNGSLKTKTKSLIVLIIPLFVSSFSKADDLSNAMETRGYNPYAKRTSYRSWEFWWFNIVVFIVVLAAIVLLSLLIYNPNSIFSFPSWWNAARCSFV